MWVVNGGEQDGRECHYFVSDVGVYYFFLDLGCTYDTWSWNL